MPEPEGPDPLDVLLFPVGSAGDINPFVGLGLELRHRGHRVTAYTSGYFRDLFERAGISFVDIMSDADFRRVLEHADLWRPGLRSLRLLVRMAGKLTPTLYDLIREHRDNPDTVVIAGPLAFGARVAQDRFGIPTVTLQLAPSLLMSVKHPPVFPSLYLREWQPLWLRRFNYWLMDLACDRVFEDLNRFRRAVGLGPARRIMSRWINSPWLTIGMFPEWFGGPARDWPEYVRVTGFPLYDGAHATSLTREAETFFEDCDRHGGPIIFTPGTGMVSGHDFFEAAANACLALERPGALLTRHPGQIPPSLPSGVRHFDYLPFSRVLPRSAALVHHGGIGTLSQACAAGIPQLIMPMAYDQHDNGQRIVRLGIGTVLPRTRFTADALARALTSITADATVRRRCLSIRDRFNGVDAIGQTCDLIEQAMREKSRSGQVAQ